MNTDRIKVMVVDDEEIPRSFLKISVDWNEIGMEVVCEAGSGSEALDLIEEFNPEIIFTDIQMPFMDGLVLSRIVAETYPHIRIVILTAYKEFDYAQDSIKIGVSDFLLKPINKADVLKIAVKLKEEIEAEKRHLNEFHSIKKQLNENFSYLREKFLIDMLENSSNSDNLTEKLAYFYSGIVPSYYQSALVGTFYPDLDKDINEEERLLLALKSIEIVKQYFREHHNVDVFFDNSHRIVVLSTDSNINLIACCEQIKALIINRIKCHVAVGIGNGYKDCRFICKTYKETLEALKYSMVSGRNHVVYFNDDMNLSDQQWNLRIGDTGEIIFFIKAGLDEKAIDIMGKWFSEMTVSNKITIEQVRVISINIISAVLGAVAEMGLAYEEIYGTKSLPYNKVFEIDTLVNMKEFLEELIRTTSGAIKTIRIRKSKMIIDDIIDYIKTNVSNCELTLSVVASEFLVNPSYLSRIFKQEKGENFTKYLLKIRMEKAMEILKRTNMKAYQVAEEVGIKDPYYFSNCFKKFTGLSVNEYLKQD